MNRYLVDENMPRSTARILRDAGYEADDVRDVGFAATADPEIFAFAQDTGATLISRDMGFANIVDYPLGSHAGIVIVRYRNVVPIAQRTHVLLNALAGFRSESLAGCLVVVGLERVRIRRPAVDWLNT